MSNKEFEKFLQTGNISDYLKYKKTKNNEEKYGNKGRNNRKSN